MAEMPAGHRYHVVDGLGGQWLCETSDEFPEPSPIGLVDDLLKPPDPPVRIQTVDAAVLLHRFDRLAPGIVAQQSMSTHQAIAREALEAMRDALRLPPGSGGTGAQAARERAYTGQPRARWDPSQDPNAW